MAKHESVNGRAANPAAQPNPVRDECSMNPSSRIPVSMPTSPGTSQEPKSGLSQSSEVAPVAPAGKATACRDGRPWPVGTDPTESERRQIGTDVRKPRNHERNVK